METTKPKIVVTWPLDPKLIAPLREKYDVIMHDEERVLTDDELKVFVKGSSAIICLLTNKITKEILEAAGQQLKIVATMTVGYDHIDVTAAAGRGIAVTNAPDTSDTSVAEHALALMFALAKSVPQADDFVRSGKYKGWDPSIFVGSELSGKTLGIIGLGHIGHALAHMVKHGLGMSVHYYDVVRHSEFEASCGARFCGLDEVLTTADFVSLHVPLLPATRHLMNAERFAMMKPTAFLVNTARGPVVEEAALVRALKQGQIAGAALDVFENEPTVSAELLALPNVILTPHTASATVEARKAMVEKAVGNVMAVLEGGPAKNSVEPK